MSEYIVIDEVHFRHTLRQQLGVQFAGISESLASSFIFDAQDYVAFAEERKFHGFLNESPSSLGERYLPM